MTGIDIPHTGNGSVGIVVSQALYTPRTGRQGRSWVAVVGEGRHPIAGVWGKDREPEPLPDCSEAGAGDKGFPCQSAAEWQDQRVAAQSGLVWVWSVWSAVLG